MVGLLCTTRRVGISQNMLSGCCKKVFLTDSFLRGSSAFLVLSIWLSRCLLSCLVFPCDASLLHLLPCQHEHPFPRLMVFSCRSPGGPPGCQSAHCLPRSSNAGESAGGAASVGSNATKDAAAAACTAGRMGADCRSPGEASRPQANGGCCCVPPCV